MNYDSMAYENPWRKNFESRAFASWVGAGAVALTVNQLSHLPPEPFYWMGGICGAMALARLPAAIRLANLQKHLKGRPLEFIEIEKLRKKVKNKTDQMWLGNGFIWENRHAQRVHEILKRDWSEIVDNSVNRLSEEQMGQTWIHGVEPKEHNILQKLSHSEGQNLIVGTTGAGKTRLFDLLITQAILRGEAVFILDPKGDKDMRKLAQRGCDALGQPEKFNFFHPAFPDESVRIDPLRNFTRVTEIASRLAALIPSEAGADPFKSFGWQAINNIAQALVMAYERPNIVLLKRFLESGPQEMVIRATVAYAERNIVPNGGELAQNALDQTDSQSLEKRARAMTKFYREHIQKIKPSSELEGLLSMNEHDKTHFSKMVANLLPIMNMLTAGDLGQLLSPDYSDIDDTRKITDNKKIIENAEVAYFGLDSLTDGTVGSAAGSMFLSDLVAVAGDRYNFGVGNKPVNIFIDEASEVINEPTIQLLNKGRGAKIKLFVATQTIADFEARLGSKEKARQVLGNLNNLLALRTIDQESQEFIADNLPKTRLKTVMRSQNLSSKTDSPLMFSAGTGERLIEEEGDLFPSQLLGMLPNLEYIAKISGGAIVKGRVPILR